MAMQVRSPAFAEGSTIPRRFTRDGDNLAPPLEWTGAPEDTRSYVVIMEDPDAPRGTFRHWGLYDIDPTTTTLNETGADLAAGESVNDFGNRGYDGPEPPRGHGLHHYHIRVAALDVEQLAVPPNARVEEVWRAALPHVLDQAETVGTYMRG